MNPLMDVEGNSKGRLVSLKDPFSSEPREEERVTIGKIQDGTCRKFGGCPA